MSQSLTSFYPATTYAVGSTQLGLATADLNGDGRQDIIVANTQNPSVGVLLGTGSGGFSAQTTYATPGFDDGIAVADVTGDGNLDIITGLVQFGSLAILPGNGSGGFGAATTFATGINNASSIVTADLNNDGRMDIITANSNNAGTVSVLLGNGSGGFTATTYADGTYPSSLAMADLNGDGRLDIVTGSYSGNYVSVLYGNGSGGFSAPVTYGAGTGINAVTIADLNGHPDIIAVGTNGSLIGFLGDGTGNFSAGVTYANAGTSAWDVTSADVNNDGNTDVIIGEYGSVYVMQGDGTGGLSLAATYATGSSTFPAGITTADVDGNGSPDIVVATRGNNGAPPFGNIPGTVVVLRNATPFAAPAVTVSGVSVSAPSGPLNAGKVISITLALSGAVSVTGSPLLTLNDGGTATYDSANSTGTSLVFTTTIASGQNATALAVTGVNLNGGSIASGGIAADLTAASTTLTGPVVVDTTAPTISSVVTSPASGRVGLNGTINITLTPSEAVTVNTTAGRPILSLNNGGTAYYNSILSTSTALVFTTTVFSGQDTADLAVTSANLNGATITDTAGNTANLSGAAVNPAGVLIVDATSPSITGVTTSPASGSLGVGSVITFTLATSEAVTVDTSNLAPSLGLNDGGTATYDAAHSTSTSLVFTTTVTAGQNASNLTINAVYGAGTNIKDAAGNTTDITPAYGPTGLVVDTTAPTIIATVLNPGSGTLGLGSSVSLVLDLSEAVTVNTTNGSPSLTLNDGGTAIYDPIHSHNNALVFTTTIAAGQNTARLAATSFVPNGVVITDAAGNALDLTNVLSPPVSAVAVDTTAPTVTAVAVSPNGGVAGVGNPLTLTLTTSEAVVVNTNGGTPTLTLNDGGTATYDAALSTATSLVFTGTVAAGQNTASLAITNTATNGATISDAAGNNIDLSNASLLVLANAPSVDTIAPTILSVSTTPGSGTLGIGAVVGFTLATSEYVLVDDTNGAPTLTLNNGGTAIFDAANTTSTALAFTTTIAAGQSAADLAVTMFNLNGASILDGGGNALDPSGAAANPAGVLQVDAGVPTIASLAATPSLGALKAGATIGFTLTSSEAVTVDTTNGAPTLLLNDGGVATYDAANSTSTSLAFTTTIAAGQNVAALAVTGAALNNAAITDSAGNAIDLSNATLATNIRVDTVAPAVTAALVQDTGASATDGITRNPALTGSGDANATVTFTQNNGVIGTTTADANGTWSFTPANLADGANSFVVSETDAAGNVGSSTVAITLDRVSPDAPVTSLSVTAGAAATAIGLGLPTDSGSGVLSAIIGTLPTNGTVQLANGSAVATGQLVTLSQLTGLRFLPGSNQAGTTSGVGYSVTDLAGNTATGYAALIVQPAVPTPIITTGSTLAVPSLAGSGGTARVISNIALPTVAGAAQSGSTVSVNVNGSNVGSTTADGNGGYSTTLSAPLAQGTQQIQTVSNGVNSTLTVFQISTPDQGVSTTDISSAVIGNLFGQGYGLSLANGTQALTLVDGTLSVGQDTDIAALQRLYMGLLGRSNDAASIGYWNQQLQTGQDLSSVASGFLNSAEYQANNAGLSDADYIGNLYTGLLGRSASTDEIGYWTGALQDGANRGNVAAAIAQSAESKTSLAGSTAQVWAPDANGALVHNVYETALGREVELGNTGLQYWDAQLDAGVSQAAFVQEFVQSPEFQALHGSQSAGDFVASLFQNGLGRTADSDALSFYTSGLQTGAFSQADVLLSIASSAEATAHLTKTL